MEDAMLSRAPTSACGGEGVRSEPAEGLRIVVDGIKLDQMLEDEAGIFSELPELHAITYALSAGTSRRHIHALCVALRRLTRRLGEGSDGDEKRAPCANGVYSWGATVKTLDGDAVLAAAHSKVVGDRHFRLRPSALALGARVCSPREAHFRASESVPAGEAVGRISAELACAYPPGIPLLVPGERIVAIALEELCRLRDAGCSISGPSDESLATIRVLV